MLFVGERDRIEGDFLVADVAFLTFYESRNEDLGLGGYAIPSRVSTCDSAVGDTVNYYAESYDLGTNAIDVLNYLVSTLITATGWCKPQQKLPIPMWILKWWLIFTTWKKSKGDTI